jgi:hypothetical protein
MHSFRGSPEPDLPTLHVLTVDRLLPRFRSSTLSRQEAGLNQTLAEYCVKILTSSCQQLAAAVTPAARCCHQSVSYESAPEVPACSACRAVKRLVLFQRPLMLRAKLPSAASIAHHRGTHLAFVTRQLLPCRLAGIEYLSCHPQHSGACGATAHTNLNLSKSTAMM